MYFFRSRAQLAPEDVHGIVTTGGSYKQGVGTFWLRKRRQLLLRYAPWMSPRRNQLTDALCYFIAGDMQPFDTANDSGLQICD